jgi:hypothetical protein
MDYSFEVHSEQQIQPEMPRATPHAYLLTEVLGNCTEPTAIHLFPGFEVHSEQQIPASQLLLPRGNCTEPTANSTRISLSGRIPAASHEEM